MVGSRTAGQPSADDHNIRLSRKFRPGSIVLQRMDVARPEWFIVDGYLNWESGIKAERSQESLKLGAPSGRKPIFSLDPLKFSGEFRRSTAALVERFGERGF